MRLMKYEILMQMSMIDDGYKITLFWSTKTIIFFAASGQSQSLVAGLGVGAVLVVLTIIAVIICAVMIAR